MDLRDDLQHHSVDRGVTIFGIFRRSILSADWCGLAAAGALLNIVLIWLQDMEIHVHLILGGVLASILALVIFLIAALDNPFRGEVSIGPDPIALVYDTYMTHGLTAIQPKPK